MLIWKSLDAQHFKKKSDEAKKYLTDLEINEKSVVTDSFKEQALSVIKDNS